ncbi:MAG: 6-carboxytetrahydropterin synthase [Acidobacteria bacterium]|nr:6-carboxytetrahydropterin synthase [Acidobacteriota bacterium]
MIHITRRYRFSASHRLHALRLSDEVNREIYGKCNNPFGHGHNYVLEVTVGGEAGEDGRVLDPRRLDGLVEREVIRPLDHRNLNSEAPEFAGLVPTTENLAVVIASRLEAGWKQAFPEPGPSISRIRLEETGNNSFELRLRSL